jgi:glycosyltransferase involved in cell wall biosynthesis
MRIAFFHNLPAGGGKRSAYEWIKLMTTHHHVDLYLYSPISEDFLDMRPYVKKTILFPKCGIRSKTKLEKSMAYYWAVRASKEIARKINDGGYDLAFIMQCQLYNTPIILRYLRVPSLYFCHEPSTKGLEPHCIANIGRLKRMFVGWICKLGRVSAHNATLICANSLYSRENIYRAYGIYPRLNYLGVDPDLFRPLSIKRENVVLSVGSISHSKAPDFIIKSISYLRQKPSIRFIYHASNTRYQSQLTKLAERLGVAVSFDYLPTQHDLAVAYNQAIVTVFPSMLEPLGLVPLESMACGTPVVGIAEAGIRETIQHNETGFLTERDPYEFSRALYTLINDRSVWAKMSVAGRQRVLQHWTWKQSYQQLEKHMQMAINMY